MYKCKKNICCDVKYICTCMYVYVCVCVCICVVLFMGVVRDVCSRCLFASAGGDGVASGVCVTCCRCKRWV